MKSLQLLHDLPTPVLKTDLSPSSKRSFQIALNNKPDISVAPLSLRRLYPFIGEYNIKTQHSNTTNFCFYFLFLSEERIVKAYLSSILSQHLHTFICVMTTSSYVFKNHFYKKTAGSHLTIDNFSCLLSLMTLFLQNLGRVFISRLFLIFSNLGPECISFRTEINTFIEHTSS